MKQPEGLRTCAKCQATTRAGKSCRSPAVTGKRVCRMHGAFAGAPRGKRNGSFKHGGETQEAVALRREASALLKRIREDGITA
ncbi:HGGxSTG domain-containing protein [Tsuneonella litorea]|uniref:HGGxSTG domain-containing protein n=1 Tax=Tsuneonella litorea TaxID=2976475 RepID=UPI0035CCE7AC